MTYDFLIISVKKSEKFSKQLSFPQCEQGIKYIPATWGYYETLGFIYMKENRLREALNMFQNYLSMNPNNKTVRYYHDLVKHYVETCSTNP
jgi:tetratricopeptide (TPR) repeat protein